MQDMQQMLKFELSTKLKKKKKKIYGRWYKEEFVSPCFNTKIDDIFFSFLNVKEDKKVWN